MQSITAAVNNLRMSSREIAELTGKRHDNVKRDVAAMLKELEVDVLKFEGIYLDSRGREQTEYLLDREHVECLLAGYSAPLRMKVIRRLHELESAAAPRVNLPDFSNPADAARAWAEQYELHVAASEALAIAAPKAEFVDRYVECTGSMTFRQVAKLLGANEHKFRQMLLERGVLYRLSGSLTPYQNHLDAGRFEIKTGTSDRNSHAFSQTRFTPKGVKWVAGLWAEFSMQEAA